MNIEVSFRDEDASAVSTSLSEVGAESVEQVEQQGFTGIELLFLAVVTADALSSLLAKLVRLWKKGVVVDTRGPSVEITKNVDLPRGTVLIVSGEHDKVTLSQPSDSQLEEAISKLGETGKG